MQTKHFRLHDVKTDSAARTIEGWASTFGNKDSDDDIILPGAFAASVKTRMPKMLWQHNSDQPIGVWTEAQETAQGLFIKGRLLETTLGNDAYILSQAGAIDSMSIGYVATKSTTDDQTWTRTIEEIDLWEVSLVTFPANDRAKITSVKSLENISFEQLHERKQEVEAALRDAGASQRVSKFIASLIPQPAQRDAEGMDVNNLINLLNQFTS